MGVNFGGNKNRKYRIQKLSNIRQLYTINGINKI